MEIIEDGNAEKELPSVIEAPMIVAFIRTIGLKAGDVQRLALASLPPGTL